MCLKWSADFQNSKKFKWRFKSKIKRTIGENIKKRVGLEDSTSCHISLHFKLGALQDCHTRGDLAEKALKD